MASFNKDGLGNILLVTVSVCLVCSIIVSGAAVALKPQQDLNKELDKKQNVLRAAGLLPTDDVVDAQGRGVEELFAAFTVRGVDLETGEFVNIDTAAYDPIRAAKDPDASRALTAEEDIATIGARENVSLVYLMEGEQGIEKLVVPVRGYGLWGTLYGYLALESDLATISGLGFYDHGETPGLGGEVDNPNWKSKWQGVRLYDDGGAPSVSLVKSRSDADSDAAAYEVDALSGATFTTRGVENLVNFWMGDLGFGPMIESIKANG